MLRIQKVPEAMHRYSPMELMISIVQKKWTMASRTRKLTNRLFCMVQMQGNLQEAFLSLEESMEQINSTKVTSITSASTHNTNSPSEMKISPRFSLMQMAPLFIRSMLEASDPYLHTTYTTNSTTLSSKKNPMQGVQGKTLLACGVKQYTPKATISSRNTTSDTLKYSLRSLMRVIRNTYSATNTTEIMGHMKKITFLHAVIYSNLLMKELVLTISLRASTQTLDSGWHMQMKLLAASGHKVLLVGYTMNWLLRLKWSLMLNSQLWTTELILHSTLSEAEAGHFFTQTVLPCSPGNGVAKQMQGQPLRFYSPHLLASGSSGRYRFQSFSFRYAQRKLMITTRLSNPYATRQITSVGARLLSGLGRSYMVLSNFFCLMIIETRLRGALGALGRASLPFAVTIIIGILS